MADVMGTVNPLGYRSSAPLRGSAVKLFRGLKDRWVTHANLVVWPGRLRMTMRSTLMGKFRMRGM